MTTTPPLATATYANGCPRVGWCVACARPVALQSSGDLVPHGKKMSSLHPWITLEEHREQEQATETTPDPDAFATFEAALNAKLDEIRQAAADIYSGALNPWRGANRITK